MKKVKVTFGKVINRLVILWAIITIPIALMGVITPEQPETQDVVQVFNLDRERALRAELTLMTDQYNNMLRLYEMALARTEALLVYIDPDVEVMFRGEEVAIINDNLDNSNQMEE